MLTNLIYRVNQTNATHDYAGNPGDYITVDLLNDRQIWTAGSDEVYNHCGYSPTSAQLNGAATWITTSPVEIAYCFLDDVSSVDKLHTVIGMGSGDNQHVFCFSLDGATATEPTLEAWDNNSHSTTDLYVLGNGTPANSMVHAVCTTTSSPGSSWSGTNLAGSGASYKVLLNDGSGALSGAKDLYANIYIKIPASYVNAEFSQPVFAIRFTYS